MSGSFYLVYRFNNITYFAKRVKFFLGKGCVKCVKENLDFVRKISYTIYRTPEPLGCETVSLWSDIMVTKKDIQATCDDIVREFAPLQVILFGSHAYGTPTEDSDVDLLVVMDIPESETTRQAGEIWQRIPRRFNMDLLVRSPKEIAYRVSHNDWFLCEITEKGEVLYESIQLHF